MVGRRIDLGIEVRVADEVHDPPLGGVLVHIKLLRQCADVDGLMNAAVGLEDEKTGVLHELVAARDQEEVVHQDLKRRPYTNKWSTAET